MQYLSAPRIYDGKGGIYTHSALVINSNYEVVEITPLKTLNSEQVQFYDDILCPGFINAHCHLELSHLHSKIKAGEGFLIFALALMGLRNQTLGEVRLQCMKEADMGMFQNGIVAVGDICNTAESIPVKINSRIHYFNFIELIAFDPARAESTMRTGIELAENFYGNDLAAGISAHAPYSVSLDLMVLIRDYCIKKNFPFTIHNQESEQENIFFKTGKGDFSVLYEQLGLNIPFFKAPGIRSLHAYGGSYLHNNTLLVHNSFTTPEDFHFLKNNHLNPWFCFCPNANLYIEKAMPDIPYIIENSNKIVIGTDSLASNHKLCILEEMKTIQSHFPFISLEEMIVWACNNGAEYLQMQNVLGSFDKGKKPGVVNIINVNGSMLSTESKVSRII
jgi:cytosine/adenosine deaminase-related metal-dependent hydrolase